MRRQQHRQLKGGCIPRCWVSAPISLLMRSWLVIENKVRDRLRASSQPAVAKGCYDHKIKGLHHARNIIVLRSWLLYVADGKDR